MNIIEFSLVAFPILVAAAIRFLVWLLFRDALKNTSFRAAIDTFCIIIVLLSYESMFIQRKEELVDPALMSRFRTEEELCGAWIITGLMKFEHFVKLVPLVVLCPSLVVGLGVHSAQKNKKVSVPGD